MIKLIGRQILREINFKSVKKFVDFLKSLFTNETTVYEDYCDLNQERIRYE